MVARVDEFERLFVRPRAGRTLIVGSYVTPDKIDRRVLYPDVVGVDMRAGPGVDLVLDMENEYDIGKFYHVECLSTLEHVRRPWLLTKNIERVMRPGATLFVTVPFNWRVHAHPDDYFRMSISGLCSLFDDIDWVACRYATYGGLIEKPKIPWVEYDGHRFYSRSMTCGFGHRR